MALNATCCVNEYRVLLNGNVIYTDDINLAPHPKFNIRDGKGLILKKTKEADSVYRLSHKVEDYSDLGVLYLYLGDYETAKNIFVTIEKESPYRYNTAANLGTTYELLGRDDSAYFWMKKAVKINPNSHNGSEWIHLKILEQKIKNKTADFLDYDVLDLNFGNKIIPENIDSLDLFELRNQLFEQLTERMMFVMPKDKIMAHLLYDLGTISAIQVDIKTALRIYEMAIEYGYSSNLLNDRIAEFNLLQAKADRKNKVYSAYPEYARYLIYSLLFLSIVLGLILLIKKIYSFLWV